MKKKTFFFALPMLLFSLCATVSIAQLSVGPHPQYSFNRYNSQVGGFRLVVKEGDILGSLYFKGLTKSPGSYSVGSAIRAVVTGSITDSYAPSNLMFMTGEELKTRMLIGENGYVSVNKDALSARFAIRHFTDDKNPNNMAFEVEGGASNAVKKFSLYNEGGLLNASLDGNMFVKRGNMSIENGNVYIPKGRVTIGSDKVAWDYALSVNGGIAATEVRIAYYSNWPDYVFQPTYQLRPLDQVADFIKENGHLPGIPSAQEVAKEGFEVAEMQQKLLEKIEELTLYIIQQQKEIEVLKLELQKVKN